MARRSNLTFCQHWCSNFSVLFLIFINSILAVGGLGIIGGGGYLLKNFRNFDELVSQQAIVYLLCSGLILFLFSVIAIGGAITHTKKLLVIYVLVMTLVVVAEVAAVILSLDYLGVIEKVGEASGSGSGSGNNGTDGSSGFDNARETYINNFLLRTYQTCCVMNEKFCGNIPSDENYCSPVYTCDSPGAEFDDVCVDEKVVAPVEQGICTALQGFQVDGNFLVGPSPESCGQGDPANFLQDFSTYLVSKLTVAGYAVLGIAVIEFLVIMFAMYLIFGKKIRFDRDIYGHELEEAIVIAEPYTSQSQNASGSRLSSRYETMNVGNEFTMHVDDGTNRAMQRRNIGAEAAAAGDRRSRMVNSTPAPNETEGRSRTNSVESHITQMSIGRRQMEENPDVIDKVL